MGYIYPNEFEVGWGILIVIYPFISGIIAGAFLIASLYRLFNVVSLKPVFRLSLLVSLAFLLSTNFPLTTHLGHPERAFEIIVTPHTSSAMAVFGYESLYLLVILTLILLYEYRKQLVSLIENGARSVIYKVLTLGDYDVSEKAVESDRKIGYYIMWIALPSVIFLHGYVGFIFGSVKANPWWNTALMPLIFLISGIVSGIALILLLYFIVSKVRNEVVDNSCVESLSSFLLLFLTIGISLELLEIAHFMYLQEEGVEIISELITQKLFASFALQLGVGGLLPIVILFCGKFSRSTDIKKAVYTLSSLLVLIGVFSMRWNVIIGGQLISKSLRGFADYHIQIFGQEGLITAITALAIPFFILWVLAKIFPLKEA